MLGSGEFRNGGRHFRLDILSKGVEALTIRRGGLLLLRECEDRRRIRPCESKSELPVRSILRRLTPSAGSILLIVVVGIDTHDLVPSLTMHRNEGNSWMIMERVTTVRVRMSGWGQKRRFDSLAITSDLRRSTDINRPAQLVRSVPIRTHAPQQIEWLFDHFVGDSEQ